MMLRVRGRLPFFAGLALLLMGAWLAIGLLHGHPHDPSCQICSALQYTAAELVAPPALAEPVAVEIELAPAPPAHVAPTSHATPRGRAPPAA
ncbi:MAG TPA: hypothetical protein VFS09_02105 [Candidatus Eisenbacteria bacterium]|nr:hypothetical protein [Candidatus Eisenbacteria bacterium]